MVVIGNFYPIIHGSSRMTNSLIDVLENDFTVVKINTSLSTTIKDVGSFKLYKIKLFFNIFYDLLTIKKSQYYFVVLNFNLGNSWKVILVFLNLLFSNSSNSKIFLWPHIVLENQSLFLFKIFKKYFKINIICLGDNESLKFNKLGFETFVIPNFVEISNEFISKQICVNNTEVKKLLFFSNFFKYKGILDFLKLVSLLKNRGFYFEVVIVGNSADFSTKYVYEKLYDILGNDLNFKIHSNLYHQEKYSVIYECDLLVYPSFFDYSPLAVLECLLLGLPVVSYNVGEVNNMIGTQGVCVNDFEEMSEVIINYFLGNLSFVTEDLSIYSYSFFKNSINKIITI